MDTTFPLTVSETGESGTVDIGNGTGLTLHIFGREAVEKWQNSEQFIRGITVARVLTDLRHAAMMAPGPEEAVSLYNQSLIVPEGTDVDHGLTFDWEAFGA